MSWIHDVPEKPLLIIAIFAVLVAQWILYKIILDAFRERLSDSTAVTERRVAGAEEHPAAKEDCVALFNVRLTNLEARVAALERAAAASLMQRKAKDTR